MHWRFSSCRAENKRWPAVVLHRAGSRDGGSEKVDFEPATAACGDRSVANRWPDVSVFKSGGSAGPSAAASQRLSSASRGAGIIKVVHGTETLEFIYTALSFVAPEKVRFKYRLHGFDRDWVDAGVQRSARYTRLPAGDYQFQVIACNNDGIWSETGASLAFAVPAPFWQTAWFLAGSGLALVGGIAALVRSISLRSMQARLAWLEQQHAVEKERTRIAKDMHDEIGAKLTKISFLSGLAKRDIVDPKKAAVEVDRISQTTREVLRGLDEIVWAVSPKNDTLDNLATYICQHAGEFFQDTGIQCHLEMPHSFPAYPLSTEVRHNLFLAVKEALTNILKHAQATEARIHMSIDSTTCEITVSDNGRGFSPAEPLRTPRFSALPRQPPETETDWRTFASESEKPAVNSGWRVSLVMAQSWFSPFTCSPGGLDLRAIILHHSNPSNGSPS